MPKIGSIRSLSMHTPATTMRAPRGAPSRICWISPGTPTHSKITQGRLWVPESSATTGLARSTPGSTAISSHFA